MVMNYQSAMFLHQVTYLNLPRYQSNQCLQVAAAKLLDLSYRAPHLLYPDSLFFQREEF